MCDFNVIKKAYSEIRESERKKIIDYLASKQSENGDPLFYSKSGKPLQQNKYRGGSGSSTYGDRLNMGLSLPYNLENWKWIEVKYKNKIDVFISLQSFDIDPSSKNVHVLYDRIGIYVGLSKKVLINYENKRIKVSDAFLKMIVTSIELPMDSQKLDLLLKNILQMTEMD